MNCYYQRVLDSPVEGDLIRCEDQNYRVVDIDGLHATLVSERLDEVHIQVSYLNMEIYRKVSDLQGCEKCGNLNSVELESVDGRPGVLVCEGCLEKVEYIKINRYSEWLLRDRA